MRKIFFSIGICIVLLFVSRAVSFAQVSPATSPVPSDSAIHLSFPIAELGNCSSTSDCKTYCDDPTHVDACIAYAKEKGFYHETPLDTEQQTVLADAKTTLGCDSVSSCQAFCADSANADACSAFAKKHNLKGGTQAASSTTLEKAKAILGCDSADSCRAFCADSTNKDKCAAFAKENGLKGGTETVGPGGCSSQSSCQAFCANPDNFQTCSQFVHQNTISPTGQSPFKGPGGCASAEECKKYCDANPTACGIIPTPSGTLRPTISISPTGLNCQEHPDTCLTPVPTLTHDAYCKLYPSHCAYPTPANSPSLSQRPLTGTPTPPLSYEQYCETKGKGCFYNGKTCVCPTPQSTNGDISPTFSTQLPITPTRIPTPTQSESVKGAETQKNFFEWLLDTLHLR